jgi:hypothetical protein
MAPTTPTGPRRASRNRQTRVHRATHARALAVPQEPPADLYEALPVLTDPALTAWLHEAGAELPTDHQFQ